MNKDIWQGRWRQVKGLIQARWGKLTHDDLDVVRGSQEHLAGRVQERYGCAKEEAEKQVKDFYRSNQDGTKSARPMERDRISAH